MMLNLAIQIALANPIEKLPQLGAVLAYRKRVISIGMNRSKTHPFQKLHAKNIDAICLHAEIDAIKNAIKQGVTDFSGLTLYVARVKKDLTTGLAKPCKGCQRAIDKYGIKEVVYTK